MSNQIVSKIHTFLTVSWIIKISSSPGGESLSPDGIQQDQDGDYTAEDQSGAPFQARAAEDDVSDADLFSTSKDDDLKRMSGASASFESSPGERPPADGPTPRADKGLAPTSGEDAVATPAGESPGPEDGGATPRADEPAARESPAGLFAFVSSEI